MFRGYPWLLIGFTLYTCEFIIVLNSIHYNTKFFRCESWTIKKAEHQRTDAFKLWCWRRLLRVPCTARKWHQSSLNIHWKDWCWSWSSNTLANWCQELTLWKRPWCWERWEAKGEEDDRGWDGWMASPTQRTWIWANSRWQWRPGKSGVLLSVGLQRVRHDLVTEPRQRHVG